MSTPFLADQTRVNSPDHKILRTRNLHLPRSFAHAGEFQLERLQSELVLSKLQDEDAFKETQAGHILDKVQTR